MRKGNNIYTGTGIDFYPLDPKKEEVKIEDIAHALSLLCRGNGHLKHFYSVGQHCINCAFEAKERGYSEKVQKACLLHDASEAYISDITRPVKKELTQYLEIEERLQSVIYETFGIDLTDEEMKQVKIVDDALLKVEMRELLNYPYIEAEDMVSKPELEFSDMKMIEKIFIGLFNKLEV